MAEYHLTGLVEILSDLSLSGRSAVNLDKKTDDYILYMHAQTRVRSEEDSLVAASTTQNTIRLYNKNTITYTSTIKGHASAITGVKFSASDGHTLYSSSMDGCIKCWDLRNSLTKAAQEYKGNDVAHFTAFDVNNDSSQICAGTESSADEDSTLMFWDIRSTNILRSFDDSHNDDITHVEYHPIECNKLVSGSTDGLVCLFDVSIDDEDDALLTTYNSGSSVSHVGWIGRQLNNVYCTTHIETYHQWSADEPYGDVNELTDVREKFKSSGDGCIDYVVDCFQPEIADNPLLLTGSHKGDLHIIELQSKGEVKRLCSLSSGHTDTVRCMLWNKETNSLITGGEDSLLVLWSKEGSLKSTTQQQQKSAGKMPSAMRKKLKDQRKRR